jgi:hypothetical protein
MIKLNLPFEYDVIGFIAGLGCNFVAIQWNDRNTYVTYVVDFNGDCHAGMYTDKRTYAINDMHNRYTYNGGKA